MDGYTGTINFSASSCSGLPAGATCLFGPISLSGGGVTTLGITTTAATASMLPPENKHRPGWWATLGTLGLAACIWLGVPPKRRRSFNLLALLFCALTITGVGCGGGSSGSSNTTPTTPAPPPASPTPAGVYTVVVTATSGSLTHHVSFTLNVQ